MPTTLDSLLDAAKPIQRIASGFRFTEGPVWFPEHGGHLIFSDIPANTMYRWSPTTGVEVHRKPSGYDRNDYPDGQEVGSNGLTRDHQGRLNVCEHGNRRVTRIEHDGITTVLASHWQGKRLNSPNDVVYKSDGALYFTDPPYGLLGQDKDPAKELPFNGVYRLYNNNLELLTDNLTRPNGLAFSPDEKYLYIANSDAKRKIWMRYRVERDGNLTEAEVFFDATAITDEGLPDGMKVDRDGNIFATGPGGVLVFTPAGDHIGTIRIPETPANVGWGDEDGKSLYITANTSVYRLRTVSGGVPAGSS
ncbi:MAG TPA: SMP-30/gluconolactonase/LRE family protein [Bryobacteraceae bacterium]|nr:SMP-30/gluconolactonase/LRE family protein [Bryobacteraceae bacterium]